MSADSGDSAQGSAPHPYDITVRAWLDDTAAGTLFDLVADVAFSWGERHSINVSVSGRPSPDDGYRECVGCGFEWFEGTPETHRSDCPVARDSGSRRPAAVVNDSANGGIPTLDFHHLAHQREWSDATFGPGRRQAGVIDHIRKELQEVIDSGGDVDEWADVIILALDGATRAAIEDGGTVADVLVAVADKQAHNEAREGWTPDDGEPADFGRSEPS